MIACYRLLTVWCSSSVLLISTHVLDICYGKVHCWIIHLLWYVNNLHNFINRELVSNSVESLIIPHNIPYSILISYGRIIIMHVALKLMNSKATFRMYVHDCECSPFLAALGTVSAQNISSLSLHEDRFACPSDRLVFTCEIQANSSAGLALAWSSDDFIGEDGTQIEFIAGVDRPGTTRHTSVKIKILSLNLLNCVLRVMDHFT